MPFLSPKQQCQSTEWKISHYGEIIAYPKLTWGLPTLFLTANSSWLPWARVVMLLIIIQTFVRRTLSASELNLRRRQSLGGEDG